MRILRTSLVLLVLLFGTNAHALPAFPGAEGFGSTTVGGRGGTVCKVTRTADDSNEGSLRYCLRRTYPRYVIFTTGGTITLASPISITSPYITIAGQTAPGDGIQVKGNPIYIMTHDVIMRGMRLRLGPVSGADALTIGWNAYYVVIDHNSIFWGTDETISIYSNGGPVNNVTFSWNIIAEGLYNCSVCEANHAMGSAIGEQSDYISIHHNLYNCRDRNPLVKHNVDPGSELVNNIMYNYYYRCGETFSPALVYSNYFRYGPGTSATRRYKCFSVSAGGEAPDLPANSVYVVGNINDTTFSDEWTGVVDGSTTWKASSPYFSGSGITVDSASDLMTDLLASDGVGAYPPSRDDADTRVVNNVINRTGSYIADPSEVGGWPTLAAGSAPTDTDGDGMPDSWETANGTNPSVVDHNGYTIGGGYANIEHYINSFFSGETTPTPTPTPSHDFEIHIQRD